MKSMKLASLAVAVMAIASAGCANTPATQPDMTMSEADHGTMSACMSMPKENRAKSDSCTGMMAKMNMSEADMKAMMACHHMDHEAMMKDETCASMAKMHPGMMKMNMHGETSTPAPQ